MNTGMIKEVAYMRCHYWAIGKTWPVYQLIHTKKRPIVLALSATNCEQVAVSPETAMGCRRIKFLQEEEGYYCTFSLNNSIYYIKNLLAFT